MMIIEALIVGAIMSVITGSLIVASLAHHPRIWLRSAPQEMKDAVEPLSDAEKRLRLMWGIPVIFSMLGLVPIVALWFNRTAQFSYFEGFAFLWLAWMVFNLVDLVIIDWLIVVWWKPSWTMLPGMEEVIHHNNYSFHFKGFLKGCMLITSWAAIGALIFLIV